MIKKTWKCLLRSVVLVCQGPLTHLVLNSANIVTFGCLKLQSFSVQSGNGWEFLVISI